MPVQGFCLFLAVWGSGIRVPLAPQDQPGHHPTGHIGGLNDGGQGGGRFAIQWLRSSAINSSLTNREYPESPNSLARRFNSGTVQLS